MPDIFVQRGTTRIPDGDLSTTVTLSQPVPEGNTFILSSSSNDWTYGHVNVRVQPVAVVNGNYEELELLRTGSFLLNDTAWEVVSDPSLVVQTGVSSISGTSVVETIDTVDLEQTFITFSLSGAGEGESSTFMLSFDSESELRIERSDATGTRTVRWWVVEWPGVHVICGEFTIPEDGTTDTVSLGPDTVDLDHTFLLYSYRSSVGTNRPAHNLVRGKLQDFETVEFRRNASHADGIVGHYFLIEADFFQVQQGTVSTGGTNVAFALDPEVFGEHSFVPTHPTGALRASTTTDRIGLGASMQRFLAGEETEHAGSVETRRRSSTGSIFAFAQAVLVEPVPVEERTVGSHVNTIDSHAARSVQKTVNVTSFMGTVQSQSDRTVQKAADVTSFMGTARTQADRRITKQEQVTSSAQSITSDAIRTASSTADVTSFAGTVRTQADRRALKRQSVSSFMQPITSDAKRDIPDERAVTSYVGTSCSAAVRFVLGTVWVASFIQKFRSQATIDIPQRFRLDNGPGTVELYGSHDGIVWDLLDTRTGLAWDDGERKVFTLNERSEEYTMYRIVVDDLQVPNENT